MMGWFLRYLLVMALAMVTIPALVWWYVVETTDPRPVEVTSTFDSVSVEDDLQIEDPRTTTVQQVETGVPPASGGNTESEPQKAHYDDLVVWGTVRTELGEVLAGEEIELASRSNVKTYEVISDDQGEFWINNVKPGMDYELTVTPRGMFRKFHRTNLVVTGNETVLDIVLQPLATGLLEGYVVNTQGHRVPGYPLTLSSLSKKLSVITTTSDPVGRFQVDDFPEGPLKVASPENSLMVKGLAFDPQRGEPITVLVDQGTLALTGRVFDPDGQAVSGATVLLSWHRAREGVETIAKRLSLTGPDGRFEIGDLSPGNYQLQVSHDIRYRLERSVAVTPELGDLTLYLEQL